MKGSAKQFYDVWMTSNNLSNVIPVAHTTKLTSGFLGTHPLKIVFLRAVKTDNIPFYIVSQRGLGYSFFNRLLIIANNQLVAAEGLTIEKHTAFQTHVPIK